jgi:hypothetical protein
MIEPADAGETYMSGHISGRRLAYRLAGSVPLRPKTLAVVEPILFKS